MYLEVLKTAFEKLTEQAGSDPEKLKSLSREEALRSFVHQQLRPLLFRDEMSRYIRLFAWESAHPSKVFLKFMATNTVSYLTTAVDVCCWPPGCCCSRGAGRQAAPSHTKVVPPNTSSRILLVYLIDKSNLVF